jgi:hypothetical protein
VIKHSLKHSPGGLTASLAILDYSPVYPTVDDLKRLLLSQGVIEGLNDRALAIMAERKALNEYVEIAHGRLPIPGTPARIEVLVDLSKAGKPRELENGSVDHRDLQSVVNVKKGTPLLRRIPPAPGIDGFTVFGKPLPAPVSWDMVLPKGKGTVPSPDDPDLLIAAIDGAVVRSTYGTIEVRDWHLVSSDIDYSTGNIFFPGDVEIKGTVRAGFRVTAEGDIRIKRDVEDSQIEAGGSIEIAGGAVGSGNGMLSAGKNIAVHHAENFVLKAEADIHIAEDVINGDVVSQGNVRAKRAIGGCIFALKSIELMQAGSNAETKTMLHLGGVPALSQQKYEFLKQMTKLAELTGSIKENMFSLVRDQMDEKGALTPEAGNQLDLLKKKKRDYIMEMKELQGKADELEKKISSLAQPFIKVRTAMPGVVIKFGTIEKLLTNPLTNAAITIKDDQLDFGVQ